MKANITKFLILVSALLLVMSCSDDDGASTSNKLIGTWELMELQIRTDIPRTREAPNGEAIFITFNSEDFEGNTSRNEFGGSYSSTSTVLTLDNFFTTEINETDWGNLFFRSMIEGYNEGERRFQYNYEINDEGLFLQVDNNDFLFFIKR